MTAMSTDVGTSTHTEWLESMDFDIECQISEHGSDPRFHDDGNAAYDVIGTCPACDVTIEVFVCTKWVQNVRKVVQHSECGAISPTKNWNFKVVKL